MEQVLARTKDGKLIVSIRKTGIQYGKEPSEPHHSVYCEFDVFLEADKVKHKFGENGLSGDQTKKVKAHIRNRLVSIATRWFGDLKRGSLKVLPNKGKRRGDECVFLATAELDRRRQ